MFARRPFWLGPAVLAVVVTAGCSQPARKVEYETVAKDAERDTTRAATLNRRAVELLERGKFDEAEPLLKQALTADLMCGPAHNNLGKVYYKQERYYLAAWEFQYAARLMPNQPEPKNNLGLVFEASGKLDDATGWYAQARKLEPDNPEIVGNLARVKIRQGDRGDEVRQMLAFLLENDTRPEWLAWAKENLARMGQAPMQISN